MLTPSSGTLADYNSAILNDNSTHIRITFPVQNVVLTDADIEAGAGVRILSMMNADTDMVFGRAVSSEITISLLNNGQYTGFDWTEEFQVEFGVEINGTTNWVTAGYFKGKKPEHMRLQEIIAFVAYDRMTRFDTMADDFLSTITYPATMEDIYHDLCTYLGLGYSAGNEIADCMAITYTESPFQNTGHTCRDLIAWIAEANCCYAVIDNTGNVKLKWFTDHTTNYSIDGDDYFNISLMDDGVQVPDAIRIICSTQDGLNLLYPLNGTIIYQCMDNPFILAAAYSERVAFITEALSRMSTVGSYIPCNLNAIGNWMVETGDIIEVGIDGDTFNLPIFSRTLTWNGGCVDDYECTGNLEREEVPQRYKEDIEEGGKLSKKYTIQSGIDITDDGITVSGGKWIKLISGGVLDVQASNFTIDSVNKIVDIGDWEFNENGLRLRETETWTDYGQEEHTAIMATRFGSDALEADETSSLYFDRGYYTYYNAQRIASTLIIGSKVWGTGGSPVDYWRYDFHFATFPDQAILNTSPGYPAIYPYENNRYLLGTTGLRFHGIAVNTVYGNCDFRIASDNDSSNIDVITQTRYSGIAFKNKKDNPACTIQADFGNADNQTTNRITVYEYSPKSTPDEGNTGYYERYRFPTPTAGLAANVSYEIMTSKDTEYTTTIADFLTAGTNVTISDANFYRWGKIAQLRIVYKRSVAVTSDTATTTIATLKSGYRPKVTAAASTYSTANGSGVGNGGTCVVRGQIPANTNYYFYSTFILP